MSKMEEPEAVLIAREVDSRGGYANTTECAYMARYIVEQHDQRTTRRFRIMGGPSVPWSFVAPHEDQARANHDQSLERLNERGGLSPQELWAVVHGKRWRDAPSDAACSAWLMSTVAGMNTLDAQVVELRKALAEACMYADGIVSDDRLDKWKILAGLPSEPSS